MWNKWHFLVHNHYHPITMAAYTTAPSSGTACACACSRMMRHARVVTLRWMFLATTLFCVAGTLLQLGFNFAIAWFSTP